MASSNNISQKIDAYAKANLQTLKQEEAKTGRKMTKFDIAQYMLQKGKLNQNEYANWMNTTEGFNAQAMTQQQKTALKQGNVWGFAGYGGGEESYLDSMTSFSQKNPVEKQNAISHRQMKLNESVAERKKKAAEMTKHIKEQKDAKQVLHPNEAIEEQKLKNEINSKQISEEDKDKTAMELSKEIAESNEKYDITDVKKHPVASILTAPLRGAAYAAAAPISLLTSCDYPDEEEIRLDEAAFSKALPNNSELWFNSRVCQEKRAAVEQKANIIKEKLEELANFPNTTSSMRKFLQKELEEFKKKPINNLSGNADFRYIEKLYPHEIDEVKRMLFDGASVSEVKEMIANEYKNKLNYLNASKNELTNAKKNSVKGDFTDALKRGGAIELIQQCLRGWGYSDDEIQKIINDARK